MKIVSKVSRGAIVNFPQFLAERIYMEKFTAGERLPQHLSRWNNTVDAMLEGHVLGGPAYLMIDQSHVAAGACQRNEGLHIDGNWIESIQAHGGGHGHTPPVGRAQPPKHNHFEYMPESIILASSDGRCRAVVGEFEGIPSETGNCSDFDVSQGQQIMFEPNRVFSGNVTMIHESLPSLVNHRRTVVRINLPIAQGI